MGDVVIGVYRSELLDRRRKLQSAEQTLPDTSSLQRLMQEVDAALERIDHGTYGLCDECHEPIEPDRLLHDPLLTLCLGHLTARQQAELEEDLTLASLIQAHLLPQRSISFDGFESATYYEPAGLVSGDYCDLINLESGLVFALGDVSGKGVASSLLMSHLHALIRSLLSLDLPLPQMLERVNRAFCESTLPSHYATLILGRAVKSGEVEICNAGHCAAIWMGLGGTALIESSGLPIGLFCTGEYSSRHIRLSAGESLVFYTDGLTEAVNASGAEYGQERLCSLLQNCSGVPASSIANDVLTDFHSFLAGSSKSDDLTLMVLRRQ